MDGKTLALWLATILFWGITPIIEKAGLRNVDPLAGLFVRTISALVGIFLIVIIFYPQSLKELSLREVSILSLSGITGGFLGMYFYFQLLKHHQASHVVPLTSTYPLITTLFAIIILREPITFQKIIGTLLIMSGIYLLFRQE
jgi:transporter family protein